MLYMQHFYIEYKKNLKEFGLWMKLHFSPSNFLVDSYLKVAYTDTLFGCYKAYLIICYQITKSHAFPSLAAYNILLCKAK